MLCILTPSYKQQQHSVKYLFYFAEYINYIITSINNIINKPNNKRIVLIWLIADRWLYSLFSFNFIFAWLISRGGNEMFVCTQMRWQMRSTLIIDHLNEQNRQQVTKRTKNNKYRHHFECHQFPSVDFSLWKKKMSDTKECACVCVSVCVCMQARDQVKSQNSTPLSL